MGKRKKRGFNVEEAVEFLNYLTVEKPLLPFLIGLIALGWAVERWVFPFSNWVPLVVAVWATIQVNDSCLIHVLDSSLTDSFLVWNGMK